MLARHWGHIGGVLLLANVAASGCRKGENAAQQLITPVVDPTDAAKCSIVPTQKKPLIVEWAPADRGALEASIPDGLLVVRYSGCEMEVLSCHVRGQQYDYRGFTQKSSSVSIRNADELYAQMPVGAAKLEGRLERADALTVALTTVGMFQAKTLEVGPADLEGICAGATHFVHRVQIGAYQLYAEQSAEVGAEAGINGGPGVGAKSTAGREVLNRDGDTARCEIADRGDDAPPRGCGAPLRLEVIPLGAQAGPACPDESRWDGSQCVRSNVVTKDTVRCPSNSVWDGSRCVGNKVGRTDSRAATLLPANERLRNACDSGDAPKCTELANIYKGTQEFGEAAKLLGQACDEGDAQGCRYLSSLYYTGQGVTQDYGESVRLGRKACDGGAAEGCTGLGRKYELGVGVESDTGEATKLYRRACEGGHDEGCWSLGLVYEQGRWGVTKDLERAVKLYRQACEGGRGRYGCKPLLKLCEEGTKSACD